MITKLVIRNYRGIEALETEIPKAGMIIKGRNRSGKTSVLNAIEAALLAQDVGSDAIRHGNDRAEILVDLGDHSIRRLITASNNTLTVSRDGMRADAPQTYLRTLLGVSSLDPMDLLTSKAKERRQKILAALPVSITVEQLRKYWPQCPDGYDVSGHGLEVVAKIAAQAYLKRTEVNKLAKAAQADAARLAQDAATAAQNAPQEAPELAPLLATSDAARQALAAIQERARQADAAALRTQAQRDKIAALRAQASSKVAGQTTVSQEQIDSARNLVSFWADRVKTIEGELASARATHADAIRDCDTIVRASEAVKASQLAAADLERQADNLEEAIAQAVVAPVTPQEVDAAMTAAQAAAQALDDATKSATAWRLAQECAKAAEQAAAQAAEVKALAERLDSTVKALTDQAPAELLASADGIRGLTLDGDDVLLDGKRLDALSGEEQMSFCIEIARRANSKSRILIVDKLEQVDPEQIDRFVQEATRDGYQLIATRVERGDMVLEAIEPAQEVEAAE